MASTIEETLPAQTLFATSEGSDMVVEQAVDIEGIGALDLTPSTCRFPLWRGNARVSHRYCGKRIESATGVYCPEHRPICFNLGAGRGRSKPSPTER